MRNYLVKCCAVSLSALDTNRGQCSVIKDALEVKKKFIDCPLESYSLIGIIEFQLDRDVSFGERMLELLAFIITILERIDRE